MSDFLPNAILTYNRLWRCGMHYDYVFFKVTRITTKGNVMGQYVDAKRTCEVFDHDYRTDVWIVDPTQTSGRICRLPHPRMWRLVDTDEIRLGIRANSCVA
jgi:hypothetical protein